MFELRRSKYANYSTNGHILIQNSVFCIHQKTYLKQIYWSSKPGLGERLERPQCTKSCLHVCTLEGALADWRRSRESILQSQKTKDDWLQFALLLSSNVPDNAGQNTFEYEHEYYFIKGGWVGGSHEFHMGRSHFLEFFWEINSQSLEDTQVWYTSH